MEATNLTGFLSFKYCHNYLHRTSLISCIDMGRIEISVAFTPIYNPLKAHI